MAASAQLLRFSLPGGLFVLAAAVFQVALGWAWDLKQPTPLLSTISSNVIATVGSVLVIGWVTYQLYYYYVRPKRPWYFFGRRRKDLGGAILQGLENMEHSPISQLRKVYEADLIFATTDMSNKAYRRAWHEHDSVVRSLLTVIATEGGDDIKRDYVALSDIYHILGACRYVPWAVFIATFIQTYVNYWSHVMARPLPPNVHLGPDQLAHPAKSAAVALSTAAICSIISHACTRNREDCWKTMTKQLRRSLRAWFTLHPDFLPEESSKWWTRHGRSRTGSA